jgi:D-tyrosyl-tRNA(Tyr) deacylase
VREGLERAGLKVEEGRFGEHMRVELVNDGPVTIVIEKRPDQDQHNASPHL